jgi:hypothetical protein
MKSRKEIINLVKEGFVCAEIGVWKGQFSKRILEKRPHQLNLIDPWIHQDYKGRWYSIEQKKMDLVYQNVLKEFQHFNNVKIHKAFSTDVQFEKQYFDFIYIDGNHSYEFVLKDLEHYYPFMKNKSLITGDDFGWTDRYCKKGPAAAVIEFCKNKNLHYYTIRDQFVIEVNK